jgi:class 3 adenylate cyclase
MYRRGTGASQREVDDLSLEAQVADLSAVIDHLRLEQFDLLGWVDGASVAIAYAAQYPERVSKLVLWTPFACGEEIATPGLRSFIDLVRENWSLARRAMADVAFPSGPTEAQLWFSDCIRQSTAPEMAAKFLEFQFSVDVRDCLSQIKAPTLVIARRGGKSVPFDAVKTVAALIPDARFLALEGDAGHGYFGDTSYLNAIDEFLREDKKAEVRAERPAAEDINTILFTDMEGSTSLTQRLGDAAAQEVLRTHNAIVREALSTHSGTETKHTGDGIMASFGSASRALECAIDIQRGFAQHNESNADIPIRVRIGLNAGEPIAEDEDLFGTAVQLAARVCDRAEAGQILASNVVQELAAGKGFAFVDNGEAALRGFEKPVRLHDVKWHD